MKNKLFLAIIALLFASNSYGQIKLHSNGRIGMFTENNPSQSLDIRSGQLHVQYGTNLLQINVAPANPRILANSKVTFYNSAQTGPISVEAAAFNTISDQRMKTNIQHLSKTDSAVSPLQKVLQLNGYTYQWKHEVTEQKSGVDAGKQTGFLAQELEKLIPEAVTTGNDSTGMKAVGYTQIIPYLVEAIKEQQALITQLQDELSRKQDKKDTNPNETSNQQPTAARNED